jgi:TonB family protein
MYLQRGVKLAQYHMTNGDDRKINKLSTKLMKFAKDNNLNRSVFYAEVLTLKAGAMVSERNGKRMLELTEEALDVFSNPSEPYDTPYPILANLYHGFAYEYEDNVFDAALSYQKVMEYVGDLDYETHPIVGRALGRWSHMRTRLQTSGEYDDAVKSGLCECWPYDVERNESVQPITRVPPLFPRKALRSGVSGYTIVQFDLDDDGNTINPKAIVSWPPEFYEKAALESLAKWEYSPRAEGETDADRTNLITTIRFQIQDKSGNPIY